MSQATVQLTRSSKHGPLADTCRSPNSPGTMHWALTAQLPASTRPATGKRLGGPTLAAVERGFGDAVARQIRGGVLRHSDRQGLLRAADRLHLERFRANLIIALVQREMGQATAPAMATNLNFDLPASKTGHRRTFQFAAAAVAVEICLGASAYWFCFH